MWHIECLAALDPSQEPARFDTRLSKKGRRLDLAVQPYQQFIVVLGCKGAYQI
jgi:hypothetical protein